MTYLGPKIIGNFKEPRNPNRKRELKRRDERYGMDPDHLANIRKLPSVLSGKTPCDPHHLRIRDERGIGLKATDQWAIPLTREEHNATHRVSGRREGEWFAKRGVDCYLVANALWKAKGDLDAMHRIILANLPGETK